MAAHIEKVLGFSGQQGMWPGTVIIAIDGKGMNANSCQSREDPEHCFMDGVHQALA